MVYPIDQRLLESYRPIQIGKTKFKRGDYCYANDPKI